MAEPRYSVAERVERAKEVKKLRDRAVRSWHADPVGNTALVIMTFKDYLELKRRDR